MHASSASHAFPDFVFRSSIFDFVLFIAGLLVGFNGLEKKEALPYVLRNYCFVFRK